MKVRKDFVTNSSSSSFIIAFENKEKAQEYFKEKAEIDSIFNIILNDIISSQPLTKEEAIQIAKQEYEEEADFNLFFGNDYKNIFKQKTITEIIESPEYIEEKNKIVNTQLQNFSAAIKDKEYLVCLEYEDHTEVGAELENMIMPFLDCVVDNFNHH